RRADFGGWISVVHEQDLGVRRAQERGGVLRRIAREPALVDRALVRVAAEVGRDRGDRAAVREAGRDVRPLTRIGALGEEAAELVERRGRRAQHAVRVVVDERDLVQYFSK